MSGTEATEATEDVQAPQAEPLGPPCADQPLGCRVEAVLRTTDRPVSEQKLNAVRVSMHVFNTPAECDALAETAADILRRA